MSGSDDSVRIDVWLWRARFFKTRALAARAVEYGAARLARGAESRTLEKPSALIRPGDGLTIRQNDKFHTVRVLALGARRGPASEARLLYAAAEHALDGGQ
jgi:ribosome-associated heat shock protein Hsp15